MDLEVLLQYALPENIDLSGIAPNAGYIIQRGIIFVSRRSTLAEQVTTLLHEIIHLAPPFRAYTESLWSGSGTRDEYIESQIEVAAQEAYRTRPDIVRIIEEILALASLDPRNKPEKERIRELKARYGLH